MKKSHALLIGAILAQPAVGIAANFSKFHDYFHEKFGSDVSNIFVSNRGDASMSLVVCKEEDEFTGFFHFFQEDNIACTEVDNQIIGFATSWPANQYRGNPNWWWTGLSGQIVGIRATNSLDPIQLDENKVFVNTYTYDGVPPGLPTRGANFVGTTKKGKTIWNAAREIDEIQEIDSDPTSATFGQILTHIPVPLSGLQGPGSDTRGRMRPCDMTITADGKYLWEPDIGGETVTGVDLATKTVVSQLVIPRVDPANRVIPFMLTTNSKYAVLENFEAPLGTVDVIDVSDPANPVHVKKITQADGLGLNPQTGEFTPGGKYHYIINNGSPEVPGDVDVLDMTTFQLVKKIALPANCRPHDGDLTNDKKFFVVNCSGSNSVAVISNKHWEVIQDVALSGTTPRGLIVR